MASLTGKGRKTRHVPLDGSTVTPLAAYLKEHRLDQPGHDDHPVFYGQHRATGCAAAASHGSSANTRPRRVIRALPPAQHQPPPTLRHSKAMHLYEAGVPLPYIRDILGHVDLSTTEIYARASTDAKSARPSRPPTRASSPATRPKGAATKDYEAPPPAMALTSL